MWTFTILALLTANVGTMCTAASYETIITPPTTHLVKSQYDFSSYNYVKFQVKACNTTAFLSIGKMKPNGLFHTDYHLVLGGGTLKNENVLYVITGGLHNPEAKLTPMRRLLVCNNFVQFDIKWHGPGGRLEFSTGRHALLTLYDPKYKTRPVSPDIGVYTSEAQGVFRIFKPQPDHETITVTPNTPDFVQSKYDFTYFNYLKFEVKACNKAYVRIGKCLGPGCSIRPDYIVVLGIGNHHNENYVVAVRPRGVISGPSPSKVLIANLLKCNGFVQFYVKWRGAGGSFELGTLAHGKLISVKDPYFQTRPKSPEVGVYNYASPKRAVFKVYNPDVSGPQSCCTSAGNQYCAMPEMSCEYFTQRGQGSTYLQKCAPGTRIDTTRCRCGHAATTPPCNV